MRQPPDPHTYSPQLRVPCGAPATDEHVPTFPATVQAEQAAAHAVSQQTPSMQWLDPHSSLLAHVVPLIFVHVPGVGGDAHDEPEAHTAVVQQTPWVQKPLSHSFAALQVVARIFFFTQLPLAQ